MEVLCELVDYDGRVTSLAVSIIEITLMEETINRAHLIHLFDEAVSEAREMLYGI